MKTPIETYKAIIEAWRAKDIDGVLALMDEAVVWHFAAAAEPPAIGKAGARKLLQRMSGDIAALRWRVFDYAQTADRLFVEGVDEYDTIDGVTIAAPFAGVLEFKDGLVVAWRDYVDVGVLAAQRAGAPISAQVKALMDREAII